MLCHTCGFRRMVIGRTETPLPGDTVIAGPVEKQPGISLASLLAAALHIQCLPPLIGVLGLGSLGSMPLIWGLGHHPSGEGEALSAPLSNLNVTNIPTYNQVLSLFNKMSFLFVFSEQICEVLCLFWPRPGTNFFLVSFSVLSRSTSCARGSHLNWDSRACLPLLPTD